MPDKYRILSLDGGGIRGVLSARILQKIVELHPAFLDKVDMFAGTSTGAILAAGLATGRTPQEMVDLYVDHGSTIFRTKACLWPHFLCSKFTRVRRERVFAEYFDGHTLQSVRDVNSKGLFISSFLLDSSEDPEPSKRLPRMWKAKFFHNLPGLSETPVFDGLEVTELLMRTSAAPTFFPIHRYYVDGGVVANNPSLCAYAEVRNWQKKQAELSPEQQPKPISVLRVGTGRLPKHLHKEFDAWGILKWGKPILEILTSAASGLANYQCKELLDDRYFSIDPLLPRNIGLDEVSAIPELVPRPGDIDTAALSQFMAASWN